ncbi:MAG: hypothetical protein HGA19_08050 [Oscillochloris sp.]|nr:hypothetical protein [Oscillochloris sp.]
MASSLLPFARNTPESVHEIWPLIAFGMGLAGLIGTARVAGEILYIFECAGAIGGSNPIRRRIPREAI